MEISGPDYVPLNTLVPVTVRNQPWPLRDADLLIVSNDPEKVAQPGLLAQEQLPPQQVTRLLYHHKNVSSQGLYFEVCLANLSSQPALVHLQHNVFGPDPDEIHVGHEVTADFWRNRLRRNGYQVQIPPRRVWHVMNRRVGPQAVISGLAEITPQSESRLYCQVLANRGPARGQSTPVDPEVQHRGLSCPQPLRVQDVTYTVGGHHQFISIGRDPLTSRSQRPLLGNYGVVYKLNLTLENPTEREARTEIAFSADGGVARGVVIIDGQVRETGLVRPSAEERVHQITLSPHQNRRLCLEIMPQSGSNYPLRLVVRPYGQG